MSIDNTLRKRIVWIIKEWRKGCSNASVHNPEDCETCTDGMINAIADAIKASRGEV